jgi:hypothetical protein
MISSPDSSTTTIALSLVAFGYWLGSTTLEDTERLVGSILVPLYTCLVLVYITLRVYHVAIENRLVLKKKAEVITRSAPVVVLDDSITLGGAEEQPIDLSGAFKLKENHNYEAFLATQGVPWALRGAANRARPTHRITHKGNSITIKIEGIIESQTTYQIHGPPVRGLVRGRLFEDAVIYIENGIQTTKRAVDDGYNIHVCRRLSKDKQQIVMDSTVTFDDGSKDEIASKQIFQRME